MNALQTTALGCASFLILITSCTAPSLAVSPRVPDNLRVPPAQKLMLEADATGVQIYDCKPSKDDPARFEWAFRAPEAELFDVTGKKIGKHYAGPTWESFDGSKVVGEVKARADSPNFDAIPWLLLDAKSASGDGVFGQTASIQRAQTVGGMAPKQGCSAAEAGKEARVSYKATYYFYSAKR